MHYSLSTGLYLNVKNKILANVNNYGNRKGLFEQNKQIFLHPTI